MTSRILGAWMLIGIAVQAAAGAAIVAALATIVLNSFGILPTAP